VARRGFSPRTDFFLPHAPTGSDGLAEKKNNSAAKGAYHRRLSGSLPPRIHPDGSVAGLSLLCFFFRGTTNHCGQSRSPGMHHVADFCNTGRLRPRRQFLSLGDRGRTYRGPRAGGEKAGRDCLGFLFEGRATPRTCVSLGGFCCWIGFQQGPDIFFIKLGNPVFCAFPHSRLNFFASNPPPRRHGSPIRFGEAWIRASGRAPGPATSESTSDIAARSVARPVSRQSLDHQFRPASRRGREATRRRRQPPTFARSASIQKPSLRRGVEGR